MTSPYAMTGHWCAVDDARMLLSSVFMDDPHDAGRRGEPITFWIDHYTLYDLEGRRHRFQFQMSQGVTVHPEPAPDPRWVAFQGGGPAALVGQPMDPALANVLLDNCDWLHLDAVSRETLLGALRGHVDPGCHALMRIQHRAAYDADAPAQFELLHAFGVPVDLRDVIGHTAYGCAESAKNEPAMRWLLEHGADPERGYVPPGQR